MSALSGRLQAALGQVTGINLAEFNSRDMPQIANCVKQLSYRFTRAKEGLEGNYLEDRMSALAYLMYFFPVNAAKVHSLLDELTPAFEDARPQRVLDLGCGPGTGAMAVLDWVQSMEGSHAQGLHCVAVDQSPASLMTCQRLWSAYCQGEPRSKSTLLTLRANLESPLPPEVKRGAGPAGYDLIIIQNVLTELFAGTREGVMGRAKLVSMVLNLLSPHGTLMLVEPALRSASRQLHEVRDQLLQEGHCTVYSPCLHERPCPALIKPDDWCHEERAWNPPSWIKSIDRDTGFIKDALKFSYVLFRKDGRTVVSRIPGLYRVVSELRVFKGDKRAWLCNEDGRPEVGRLDRERSVMNADLDLWSRGAIVKVTDIARKEVKGRPSTVGRIQSTARVQMVRQADQN